MIKREFTNELNKTMQAMEKMDTMIDEIKNELTDGEFLRLEMRYQDLCDCVYRMAMQGHKLERYECVDQFRQPLAKLFAD